MSLYPSVWRESDCESHFIVSHGRVWLMRGDLWRKSEELDESLIEAVAVALRSTPAHYSDMADALALEPWDVLDACRALVRRGRAAEGDRRGTFGQKK
jgi:hypothetical protein